MKKSVFYILMLLFFCLISCKNKNVNEANKIVYLGFAFFEELGECRIILRINGDLIHDASFSKQDIDAGRGRIVPIWINNDTEEANLISGFWGFPVYVSDSIDIISIFLSICQDSTMFYVYNNFDEMIMLGNDYHGFFSFITNNTHNWEHWSWDILNIQPIVINRNVEKQRKITIAEYTDVSTNKVVYLNVPGRLQNRNVSLSVNDDLVYNGNFIYGDNPDIITQMKFPVFVDESLDFVNLRVSVEENDTLIRLPNNFEEILIIYRGGGTFHYVTNNNEDWMQYWWID